MNINLSDYFHSYAVGLRFKSNFKISSRNGEIIDDIIYKYEKYFGAEIFSAVEETKNIFELKLVNSTKQNTLTINQNNIVLQIDDPLHKDEVSKDFNKSIDAFEKAIMKGIVKDTGVEGIVRIGVLKKYKFNKKDICEVLSKIYNQSTPEKLDEITFRFNFKKSDSEALKKEDINDYLNNIFIFESSVPREITLITFDFQKYFDPPLESISDLNLKKYLSQLSEADKYIEEWINLRIAK